LRYKRKRLLLIKQKHLRLFIGAAIVLAVFVILSVILSATGHEVKKQSAVNNMKSTGLINIGLRGDIGKLCTYNEDTGKFEGFEKDVADEIVSRLFGSDVFVNYVVVNSETRGAYLRNGDIDIGFGAATNMKEKGIIYSSSYFSDGSGFLVIEDNKKSMGAISGGTVGIVQDTMHALESEKKDHEKGATLMSDYLKILEIEAAVKIYASYPEAIQALRDGFVDAVCASETMLTRFGMTGMLLLPERFMPSDYRICAASTQSLFVEALDDTIAAMKQDGTLDALMKKWDLVNYTDIKEQK